MFDPKKVGAEADEMIRRLNTPEAEQPAEEPADEAAEDQGVDEVRAEAGEEATQAAAEQDDAEQDEEQGDDSFQHQLDEMRAELQKSEQRYRSLQGMYDKRERELDSLRAVLAQVSEQREQEPAAPAKPTEQIKFEASAAERDNFGEDLIAFVQRMVSEMVAQSVNPVAKQFAELKEELQGVEQVATRSHQELFHEKLTLAVPNWQEVNVDPEFVSWAQGIDPGTGQTRLALLQLAYADRSVERTAYFFKAYLAEKNAPEQPKPSGKASKFVAPGKSKSAAPSGAGNDPIIWTGASIAKFYDDHRAGKIKADEFNRLERDLFRAQRENRISA